MEITLDTHIHKTKQVAEQKKDVEADSVAIVGISFSYPGIAGDISALSVALCNKKTFVNKPSDSRLNKFEFTHRHGAEPYNIDGAYLEDIDRFDFQFFGMNRREAVSLDPQQRMLLQLSWHAFEDAGIDIKKLKKRPVGVYVGMSTDDYARIHAKSGCGIGAYSGLGIARSLAAGRLAYFYDLRGPAMQIDTACSSSFVALDLACKELRSGGIELALVGGVNLILDLDSTTGFCEMQALSPTGLLQPFDESANGYVRGEGCAFVVLKPHAKAIADGDHIYGVIYGSAVNHDGRTNGLTAPNGLAQEELLKQSIANAGLNPVDIQYHEAHGTGTPLGDAVEAKSISAVFGQRQNPLYVGSTKANFGHHEAASGMLSVIKVLAALSENKIPPQANYHAHNPKASFGMASIIVPSSTIPWERNCQRLATLSNFGMSGTNGCLVIGDSKAIEVREATTSEGAKILAASAPTQEGLRAIMQGYKRLIANTPNYINDICDASVFCRTALPFRWSYPASNSVMLQTAISEFINSADTSSSRQTSNTQNLMFVFSGLGGHYTSMGSVLYASEPVFRNTFDRFDGVYKEHCGEALAETLFERNDVTVSQWSDTKIQGAICALECALFDLWISKGIIPTSVVGHSFGEYAAAYAAGVMSLEVCAYLVIKRIEIVQKYSKLAQSLLVHGNRDEVEKLIQEHSLWIAAENSTSEFLVSGESADIDILVSQMETEKLKFQKIPSNFAFHTPMMSIAAEAYAVLLNTDISFSAPKITYLSTQLGEFVHDEVSTRKYWCHQLTKPVQFARAIQTAIEIGYTRFVEVGPTATISPSILRCTQGVNLLVLSSLRNGRDDISNLEKTMSALFDDGFNFTGSQGRKFARFLPKLEYSPESCWLEKSPKKYVIDGDNRTSIGLGYIGTLRRGVDTDVVDILLSSSRYPHLAEHCIYDTQIFAGASYIGLMIGIGKEILLNDQCVLANMEFVKPLVIPDHEEVMLHVELRRRPDQTVHFEAFTSSRGEKVVHCRGNILKNTAKEASDELNDVTEGAEFSAEKFYRDFHDMGYTLGASFKWLHSGLQNGMSALRFLERPQTKNENHDAYAIFPGLIDSCFHAIAGFIKRADLDGAYLYVPARIDAINVYRNTKHDEKFKAIAKSVVVGNGIDAHIVGNVSLYDSQGRCVASIQGAHMRRIAKRTIINSLKRPSSALFTKVWQEMTDTDLIEYASADNVLILLGKDIEGVGANKYMHSYKVEATPQTNDALALQRNAFRSYMSGIDRHNPIGVTLCIDEYTRPASDGFDTHKNVYFLAANLIAELESHNVERIVLISFDAYAYKNKNSDISHIALAAIKSGLRSIQAEATTVPIMFVDMDRETSSFQAVQMISRNHLNMENEIVIRNGRAFKSQWSRELDLQSPEFVADPSKTYVVTGGLGGVGLIVTAWLLKSGAKKIVLCGKQQRDKSVVYALFPSKPLDATIEYLQCDISDLENVHYLLKCAEMMGALGGVFHLAGVSTDALFQHVSTHTFQETLGAKALGGIHIQNALGGRQDVPLVLFSSIAAEFPSVGQSSYGVANGILDQLAWFGQSKGVPIYSINLGPVSAGLYGKLSPSQKRRLNSMGLNQVDENELESLLNKTMRQKLHAQTMFVATNNETVLNSLVRGEKQTIKISETATINSGSKISSASILTSLINVVSEYLGNDTSEINKDLSLTAYGTDSLFAAELVTWIKKQYQVMLPLEHFIEGSSLEVIAKDIATKTPLKNGRFS
ncbi:Phenolphthiocerol synthesis polyketide synthase type I Pks15/1 [Marinomonas spartinae]|uniref:type I polyketide synthase n=1 Tax=Marinomonas spartinae TaxID=1792290 RepID=UPI000808EEC2|nr:type I polyketide synthase [Marinomonas spartinae]SBS27157.1 Phenolphthiocerol synthesis polyketide synthase type I Pks15/1 [Marinomonas spartinae]